MGRGRGRQGLPAPRGPDQPHRPPATGKGGIKLRTWGRHRSLSCTCRLTALLSVSPAKAEDSRGAGPLPAQNTVWPRVMSGRTRACMNAVTTRRGWAAASRSDADASVLMGVFSTRQGGFGILEEMCVNYVHYYPQTRLELCKSAVDPGFLQKYFHLVNR